MLGLRQVNQGQYLDSGTPVVEITQVDPLELEFGLPQRYAAELEVGQAVLGTVDQCGQRFEARVDAIDPRVDPGTRAVRLQAVVPNEDGRLLPGMAVRVRLVVGTLPDAVVVPQEAIIRQGTKHLVYVVDDEDRARQREVALGTFFVDGVHVSAGVDARRPSRRRGAPEAAARSRYPPPALRAHREPQPGARLVRAGSRLRGSGVRISEISIERPVLASVMSLLIVVAGAVAFFVLPVREYPDVDPPQVSVRTTYAGASPETVETTITEPIEQVLNGIEGIRTIESTSGFGMSVISIEFVIGRDIDLAATDVSNTIQRALRDLPAEAERPIVSKAGARSRPIMWLNVKGENYSPEDRTDLADRIVKTPLQVLPGVARVWIGGSRRYAMRIWLDPLRMAARGVDAEDVRRAIRENNLQAPAGELEAAARKFTLNVDAVIDDPRAYEQIIIREDDGVPVRIGDVGHAQLGSENYQTITRFSREPIVGVGIVRQSRANELAVARSVLEPAPGDPGVPSRRRRARRRRRQHVLRRGRAPAGLADPGHRLRRGGPGESGLPSFADNDGHHRRGDSRVVDRHVRRHAGAGILDQLPHPARHGPGDRAPGGRLDRGAGERVPTPGARRIDAASGTERLAGGGLSGDRDHHRGGRGADSPVDDDRKHGGLLRRSRDRRGGRNCISSFVALAVVAACSTCAIS